MLNERVFAELESNINAFIDRIIDISEAPAALSAHLNAEIAKLFSVSREELTTQVVENRIQELAAKAEIEAVSLWKEQLDKDTEAVIERLRAGGKIILLK
jgi:tetrahydromethanopterin S-methyltransferase subunit H